MYISKQSEVYSMVREKGLNLEEMKTPPYKLWLIRSKEDGSKRRNCMAGALVYFAIGLLAVVLLVRILILQYVQRGKWADMSEKYVFKTAEVQANRAIYLPVMNAFWQVQFHIIQYIWIPEVAGCHPIHGQAV